MNPHRRTLMLALPAAPALWSAGCASSPPPAAAPGPAPAPAPAPASSSSSSSSPPPALSARPWTNQPAFSIVRVDIRDGKAFGDYAVGHTPTIAAAGGRFIAAGAMPETIEGSWPARRMVIHQWTSAQAFLDWYASAAYAPWKSLRHAASSADVVLVQGVAGSAPSAEVAPAFVVIDVEVRDGPAFGRYVQGHMPGLIAAGGEFLVAGGRFEVIEGEWKPRRLVMHRWPSAAAFRGWYGSAEYWPWREQRFAAASTDVALVMGLSEKTKIERRMP
jgi:uncharacterized protein (DUF1330 family)